MNNVIDVDVLAYGLGPYVVPAHRLLAVAHYGVRGYSPRTGQGVQPWLALLSKEGKAHAVAWAHDGPSAHWEEASPDPEWVEGQPSDPRWGKCPLAEWHDPQICGHVPLVVVHQHAGVYYPRGWK
ncbi:MAG: hypothetical protein WBB39_04010 [Candidatus Saccharimonadales bacterium]